MKLHEFHNGGNERQITPAGRRTKMLRGRWKNLTFPLSRKMQQKAGS
jgi:hypothetical protein